MRRVEAKAPGRTWRRRSHGRTRAPNPHSVIRPLPRTSFAPAARKTTWMALYQASGSLDIMAGYLLGFVATLSVPQHAPFSAHTSHCPVFRC